MTKVYLPTNLRSYIDGKEFVEVQGETIGEIIESLKVYGLEKRLMGSEGVLRFINIYLGDEDIRFLEGMDTEIEGQDVVIMAAIAGGSRSFNKGKEFSYPKGKPTFKDEKNTILNSKTWGSTHKSYSAQRKCGEDSSDREIEG